MAPSSPFRSTVFRLAVAAIAVVGIAAALIVAWVAADANRALTEATQAAIATDAADLRAEHARGGTEALASAVEAKARHATGGLYLLTDAAGRKRAGNLVELPTAIAGGARAGIFRYALTPSDQRNRTAAGRFVDIDGGGLLVIARDIEGQRDLLASLYRSLSIGLALLTLLGASGAFLLARHILRRIDAMSEASRSIMAGRLDERLPLAGGNDELDRLAAQLNAMLERIERLMNGLREVSDNIAHDLKTPLNRLRNSAESALADTRGSPAWHEGLVRTIEEADALINTFNALLLIARLEAGAVERSFEPLDLATIARDVAELYDPVAEEQGFTIIPDARSCVMIRANRQLVGQALANLIDNAIKYATPSGKSKSTTSISISVAATDRHAVLTVADRGPGISAADRARVLKRFVRLEESRSMPGSGLGLSLVAAVADLHGGTLSLDDNRPGLRVVLTLPLAPALPDVAQSRALTVPPAEKV